MLEHVTKVRHSDDKMPPRKYIPDIPVQWESEVRTLKSLAIVFFMAVVPYIYCANIIYVVADSIVLIHHRKFSDVDLPLSLMFCIWYYLLPTSVPW